MDFCCVDQHSRIGIPLAGTPAESVRPRSSGRRSSPRSFPAPPAGWTGRWRCSQNIFGKRQSLQPARRANPGGGICPVPWKCNAATPSAQTRMGRSAIKERLRKFRLCPSAVAGRKMAGLFLFVLVRSADPCMPCREYRVTNDVVTMLECKMQNSLRLMQSLHEFRSR
jgi:hypothetical protein